MKKLVLVMAVLAALGSRAALAASEGGDTWSMVQQVQQSPSAVLQSVLRAGPAPALNTARAGSEGGDTWSSLRALHETTGQQAGNRAHTASTDAKIPGSTGSEGGDTWSRFLTPPERTPATTVGITSDEVI